jgi:hypothetical protein
MSFSRTCASARGTQTSEMAALTATRNKRRILCTPYPGCAGSASSGLASGDDGLGPVLLEPVAQFVAVVAAVADQPLER